VAQSNPRNISTIPGKLVLNPTSLTAAYPGGGTELGIVQDIVLTIEQPYKFIEAEEFGGQRVEAVVTREGCALGAVLRAWDKDALNRVFPNTALGAVTGKRKVSAPGTIRPGEKLSDRSVVLVFWPDDRDRHPFFVMWRALPAIQETSDIQLKLNEEFGLPVMFFGIQDTSGRLYTMGLPHDITFP
jgi:hypothetical protein